MDTQRLQASFAHVAAQGDDVAMYMYMDLSLNYPQTRELFPVSMVHQRDRFLAALGRIVARVDRAEELTPFLRQLGRDHRKFGTLEAHYPAVRESLLATLAHFSGERWTPELASDWRTAYDLVAGIMCDAARESAAGSPPWWNAEVVAHERRSVDLAVLTVRPSECMAYWPGQSLAVESARRPRLWRYLSPANAPREDGTLDLHVRMIDGGPVSTALVRHTVTGDVLRLGAPVGHRLVPDPARDRDLLLVAGGTGLAPLKAIIEHITTWDRPPRVALFHGARRTVDLYDRADLDQLAKHHDWLTVTYALSDHDAYGRDAQALGTNVALGPVGAIAARAGDWTGHEVFVCGSPAMLRDTVPTLAQTGIASDHIRFDELTAR